MIPKITLKDLHEDVFLRSTLISIPELNEFFKVEGSPYSSWKVFYRIVYEALQTYEYYYPYNFIQKMYIKVEPNRTALCYDNFKSYLDGIITEDQINIIPGSVMGLSMNGYAASGYPLVSFRYEPPNFRDFWYSSGTWYANTLINRPFFEEYNKTTEEKEPTDRCAIYFMNKGKDSTYKIFRDQLYIELCRYIVSMKKNVVLPSMPVELFGGLEEDIQRIEGKLEAIYQGALTSSAWFI